MLRLILRHLSGSRRGTVEVYPTSRTHSLTVGRDPSSDVRFHADQDLFVSRHHAVIEWKPAGEAMTRFMLVDLLSSNGTYLNGERLGAEGRELKTGDRVGDRMEILAGLDRGDLVAITDVDTLTDGMKVAVAGE